MERWSIAGCCCIYSLVVPGQRPGGCSEGDVMGRDQGGPGGLTAPHTEDVAMNSGSLHPNHPGFNVLWRCRAVSQWGPVTALARDKQGLWQGHAAGDGGSGSKQSNHGQSP